MSLASEAKAFVEQLGLLAASTNGHQLAVEGPAGTVYGLNRQLEVSGIPSGMTVGSGGGNASLPRSTDTYKGRQ